ncbi:hypothetical protein [Mesorhizobium sp. 113-3-3]|uniref:hypothetical protein n=1 Tax=Mesorhizobium sp. 113-3-3 TaxID=2744516 RepID=UPI001928DE3F|nr:hypothetical protein [Mesorhizobium sp. 113-3-3]BCG76758.1 hypothetical protein MesoLj113b_03000 [Mesorhizobium sp. 113-3-3]
MALDVEGLSDPFQFPSDEALRDLDQREQVQSLLDWFFHNFEDPGQSTPYDGAEGGYQYIWGGPHDAREQLEGRFGGSIDEAIIDEAVNQIERRGVDWVPSNIRIVNVPEEDENEVALDRNALTLNGEVLTLDGEVLTIGEEGPNSPEEAAANVAASLQIFEAAVDALGSSPGIGHNKPPEAISDPALTPEDVAQTKAAIEALKEEISASTPSPSGLQGLRGQIASVAKKVRDWLVRNVNVAITGGVGGIAAAAGHDAYSWAVNKLFPQQHQFLEAAIRLAHDIGHWIALLPPLF